MEKRRIFIAIGASEHLQKEILNWVSDAGSKLDKQIRWIRPEDLHITLVPPWYEENVERIASKLLEKIHGRNPFEIRFANVSYGPDPKNPRLIWASGEAPVEIKELKMGVETALGFESGERPYLLHITIARFKEGDFEHFKIKELNGSIDWRDEVKSIRVMESHLSRSGAEYEILKEISI